MVLWTQKHHLGVSSFGCFYLLLQTAPKKCPMCKKIRISPKEQGLPEQPLDCVQSPAKGRAQALGALAFLVPIAEGFEC